MTTTLGLRQGQRHRLSLDAQLAALTAAGVDPARVFTEELSGSAKSARPLVSPPLDYARHGDIVVVSASTAWAGPSLKSPAPSPISESVESRCAPYEKESTPPPDRAGAADTFPWRQDLHHSTILTEMSNWTCIGHSI